MIDIDAIYKIVKKLKEKYSTSNPAEICKKMNIILSRKKIDGINGYFILCLKKKVIVINEDIDDETTMLVIAHELGHAILHSDNSLQYMRNTFLMPKGSVYETEADIFAILLLGEDFYIENVNSIKDERLKTLNNVKKYIKGTYYNEKVLMDL